MKTSGGESARKPVVASRGIATFFHHSTLERIGRLERRLQALGAPAGRRRPDIVQRAIRELDDLVQTAGHVRQGIPGADGVFKRTVQRFAAGPRQRAAALLRDIPAFGGPCGDTLTGAMEVLQAGFSLDFAERNREAPWTGRAGSYVRQRIQTVNEYATSMARMAARGGDPSGFAGRPPRGGEIPGSAPDAPPVIPPDGGTLPGDPIGGGSGIPGLDPCEQIADLCITLFEEMAIASLGDPFLDLVATVEPNCICYDYDPNQIFTARPQPGSEFPDPIPAGVDLVFRGEIITPLIVSVGPQEIRFRIPPGSQTGYVYLRSLIAQQPRPGVDLSRLCGDVVPSVPNIPYVAGSPNALITIVYPPVISSITVDGIATLEIEREACRSSQICWRAHVSDQPANLPLPPCASIEVAITDSQGNQRTEGPAGCFSATEDVERSYRFRATSLAGAIRCGASEEIVLRVTRFRLLRLRLDEPVSNELATGSHGRLTVSVSCPAPPAGIDIGLAVSRPNALDIPTSVRLASGESEITVEFAVRPDAPRGLLEVIASAAGHRDARITFTIVVPIAFVLSGGGAMGSFEVGSLLYFAIERWDEIEPDIVCGSSVGSINALPLAEGTGLEGIRRLERVWLSLRYNEDMYVDTPEFAQIKQLVGDIQGLSVDDFVKPEAIVTGVVLGGLTGGIVGFLVGAGLEGRDLGDKVGELIPLVTGMRFLYSLRPTRTKTQATFLFPQIAASGKRLRMAMVCLEDGEVYYMNEQGQLIRGNASTPDFVGELAGPIDEKLTNGAMASSGIPAVFPFFSFEVTANNSTQFLTMVDGGVREALPVRAATELGARLIIAISATPNRVPPAVVPPGNQVIANFRNERWMSMAVRSVFLAVFEVARNELAPDLPYCDGIDRIFVVPTFPVVAPTEIQPGLILINMAYGYMRAFDEYSVFRGLPPDAATNLRASSDGIIGMRRQIWELEEEVAKVTSENLGILDVSAFNSLQRRDNLASFRPTSFFFDAPILGQIRQLKVDLLNLVVLRFDGAGAESMPKAFSDASLGYLNPTTDWWGTWERHREPLESFLRGFDLWSALPIQVRIVVRNELGSPEQVFETSVPPRPVTPERVRVGLQP